MTHFNHSPWNGEMIFFHGGSCVLITFCFYLKTQGSTWVATFFSIWGMRGGCKRTGLFPVVSFLWVCWRNRTLFKILCLYKASFPPKHTFSWILSSMLNKRDIPILCTDGQALLFCIFPEVLWNKSLTSFLCGDDSRPTKLAAMKVVVKAWHNMWYPYLRTVFSLYK